MCQACPTPVVVTFLDPATSQLITRFKPCGRWGCSFCRTLRRLTWRAASLESIGALSCSLHVATVAKDEWRSRLYSQAKRDARKAGESLRYYLLDHGDGSITVFATHAYAGSERLSHGLAMSRLSQSLESAEKRGDTTRPVSCSRGWGLPEKQPSGLEFVGTGAKPAEVLAAVRESTPWATAAIVAGGIVCSLEDLRKLSVRRVVNRVRTVCRAAHANTIGIGRRVSTGAVDTLEACLTDSANRLLSTA